MSHMVLYQWFRRTKYIPRFGGVLQELGILLGGCLTENNQWGGSITGDDGFGFIKLVFFKRIGKAGTKVKGIEKNDN